MDMPSGSKHAVVLATIALKWKELTREDRKKYVDAFVAEKSQRAAESVGAASLA